MNIESMSKRAASLGGDVLWIPLKDGITTVRVVSRTEDDEPWREVYRHFLQNYVQVDDFTKAPICLGDETCPGCIIANDLRSKGDDNAANKSKAQRRFIWVAISRDNPYDDEGNLRLKLLESPTTVFQGMARVSNDWNLDFTDPDEGCDLEIVRTTGTGIPKYEVRGVTTREGATMTVVKSPLTEEERILVADSYPNIDELTQAPDPRRFRLAVGFSVDEPPVRQNVPATDIDEGPLQPETPGPAAAPQEPAESSADTDPATSTADDLVCPYFGSAYDSGDEACRQCNAAAECKEKTEGTVPKTPQRKAVP